MAIPQYLLDLMPDEIGPQHWSRNEPALRQLVKEHPENEGEILFYLMMNLSLNEKDDECIEVCHRLLQIEEMKKRSDEMYLTLARCHLQKKETGKAIEYYGKAIEHDPECTDAIMELAEFYCERSDWDNAIATYDLFKNVDDDSAKGDELNGKGWAYCWKKEYDKALDCYNRGVEMFPDQSCFYHGLGVVYGELKEWDTALEWLTKELEREPKSAEAYYCIGICWQEKDDYYRSLHNYMEALKIQPEFPEVYNNMARLFLEHEGNIGKAIEMLEKSLETNTDGKGGGLFYLNLSRVYRTISDYDKADYYKEKFFRSLGFDVEYRDEDDDDYGEEV